MTTDEVRSDVSPPPRTGRWSSLVPVEPQLHEFLYRLAIDPMTGFRWRFGGAVPTRAEFENTLWGGVLCQFVVIDRQSQMPAGLVVAYHADHRWGYAYLAAAMAPERQATGMGIEAMLLFANFVFVTWNFRKLYLEVPEYNLEWMANSVGGLLKKEGHLRKHSYYGHRWWDQYILALYPEELYEHLGRLATLGIENPTGKD